MKKLVTLLVLAAGLSVVSMPLFAHHGTAGYDTTKTVTVNGAITDFQFVNPHVQVFFDVKNDQGQAEKWQAELTSPNHLARTGWSRSSLKPGDAVTVTGYRAKTGANSIWIEKITVNGQELKLTAGDS